MPDMNHILATHDLFLMTLDTLRYDVADREMRAGRTPVFARLFPEGWQKCHSPASFTYAAHHAFFAGFLPTPVTNPRQNRLFAMAFPGATTQDRHTAVFEAADVVSGLRAAHWKTYCIGGVGFFNMQTPLGRVLPDLFEHAYWRPEFGVTEPESPRFQFGKAADLLEGLDAEQRFLMFINVAAIHQPNRHYLAGADRDTLDSHAAALRYVDRFFEPLLDSLTRRERPVFLLICSDHGTAYGEDGYVGHRAAHETIWTVPLAFRSTTELRR